MWQLKLIILTIIVGFATAPFPWRKKKYDQVPERSEESDLAALFEQDMKDFGACKNSSELIELLRSVYYAVPSYQDKKYKYKSLNLSLYHGLRIVGDFKFKNRKKHLEVAFNVKFPSVFFSGILEEIPFNILRTMIESFDIHYNPMTMKVSTIGEIQQSEKGLRIIFDNCSMKRINQLTAKVKLGYTDGTNRIQFEETDEKFIPESINYKLMVTLTSMCHSFMNASVFGGPCKLQLEKLRQFLRSTPNVVFK